MKARNLQLLPPSAELVCLSRTGAEFATLSFEQWIEVGRQLCLYGGCAQWWIGDWLNYAESEFLRVQGGKRKHGIKYRTALEATGLEIETLRQFAWVSGAVKTCTRVHALSWTHHREVAKLGPQDQEKFLTLAADGSWSHAQLRRAIRCAHKTAVDGPALEIGFVPGKWANELRRGWQGAIERMGPVTSWSPAVRRAWKADLKIAVDVYEQL